MPYADDFIDILGMERFELSELLQSTLARLVGGYSILSDQETYEKAKPNAFLAKEWFDKGTYYSKILNSYRSFEDLNTMEMILKDLKGEVQKMEKLRDEMDIILLKEKREISIVN